MRRDESKKRMFIQQKELKIQAIYDIILCTQSSNTAKGYRIIIFNNL